MIKNCRKPSHPHRKKKIDFGHSDPGGTLHNLKPSEEIYLSKEVKENALASEGKSCRPKTITAENQNIQCIQVTDNNLADRF